MFSWVEVTNDGAARAAAGALSDLGEQIGGDSTDPPEPVWGDDEFGAEMLAKYPRDIVADCLSEKRKLGTALSSVGSGAAAAVAGTMEQDDIESEGFGNLPDPRV